MPFAMDAVKPMVTMVRKAVMQTVGSSQSMFLTFFIISVPTRTMAPTVHAPVNVENIPENSRDSANSAPAVSGRMPVRAPDPIPVTDST